MTGYDDGADNENRTTQEGDSRCSYPLRCTAAVLADLTDALPAHFERDGYRIGHWGLDDHGACRQCGTAIPGVFDPEPGRFGARRIPVRISQAA